MSLPSEPDEFRYRSDARKGATSLLGVAAVLFIASLITGAWAIASLAHASFLDTNDLPVGDNVAWGVGLLVLATLQGVSALLVLFDRRAGVVLGIAMAIIASCRTWARSARTRRGRWSRSPSTSGSSACSRCTGRERRTERAAALALVGGAEREGDPLSGCSQRRAMVPSAPAGFDTAVA